MSSRISVNPEVSVIICTYNGQEYIRSAIDSILNQTYSNFELIIVDDGSKDLTTKILDSYVDMDERISVYKRNNHGLPASRNFGLSKATGNWVAILDQDDLSYTKRLEAQINVSKLYPSAALIFGDTNYIDSAGNVTGSHLKKFNLPPNFIKRYDAAIELLRQGCYVDSEALFFKRAIFNNVGSFDEELKYACDYDYFIRVGFMYDFAYTADIIGAWRIHPKQETATNKKQFFEYRLVLIRNLINNKCGYLDALYILYKISRSYAGQCLRFFKSFYKGIRFA